MHIWTLGLPYLLFAVFTAWGLAAAWSEVRQAQGWERLQALGPMFMAMPLAVFAGDHFVETRSIAGIIPSWIPGHIFWTIFVGCALLAAATAITAKRCVGLAAFLLGVMWVLFEVLMHLPAIARVPHARIAWNIALRDISFAGGAFALAMLHSREWRERGTHRLFWVPRLIIGVPLVVFGAEAFRYASFLPGVPDSRLTPAWIPLPLAWSYIVGAIELGAGLCLLTNRWVRTASTALGVTILVLVMTMYLAILIVFASSVDNGLNYFTDTLVLSGVALIVARGAAGPPDAATRT